MFNDKALRASAGSLLLSGMPALVGVSWEEIGRLMKSLSSNRPAVLLSRADEQDSHGWRGDRQARVEEQGMLEAAGKLGGLMFQQYSSSPPSSPPPPEEGVANPSHWLHRVTGRSAPVLLVLGNESKGVGGSDVCAEMWGEESVWNVSIPRGRATRDTHLETGVCESLNVAAAGAVMMAKLEGIVE